MSNESLEKLVKAALEAREQARTFRTKVGVAIETCDGKIFPGFNVESYYHKGYHGEEVAVIRGLAEGYNGTDFLRLVEVFQDAGHNELETFPACPYCWMVLWENTHPDFEIIVADTQGNVHYRTTLKEIIHPPAPGQIYPSGLSRKVKPRLNSEPKLPR